MRQANRIFELNSNIELSKSDIVTLDIKDFLQSRIFNVPQS